MPRFLALDWDQNQLHLVAANVRGGTVKVERAAVWHEEQSPNPANAADLGRLLRERLRAAGIAPAPVLACVGRDRVILKDLRYPAVPATEEPALVRFQAGKELTHAPDEVVIDYAPTGNRQGAIEYRSLALILRRELLATHQALCEGAGLKLAGLTPRPFALVACFRKVVGTTVLTPAPDPPDGAVALVVLGERWGEFCVFRGEDLLLTRSLNVGPGLAGEVRRNLAVFAGQSSQQPVRALYLAGNAGGDLRERLGDLIDLPIHAFDPFAGSESTDLPAGNRGGFAGAAGLLFARAGAGGLPVNFVQPKQPRPPADPKRRLVLGALGVAAAVIALAFVGRSVILARATEELHQAQAQLDELEAQLPRAKEDASRLKALETWDGPVWLDEIYDLAARIPDVNALRIIKITAEPRTPTPKSPHSAKVTIIGITNGPRNNPRAPVDQLMAQFTKVMPDKLYYSAEPLRLTGNPPQFTLTINVERRPPEEYQRALKVEIPKEDRRRGDDDDE